MRYGIFSDVHGNFPALQAVVKALAKESIDEYYCVGDVVGYGADPDECIRLIKELPAVCVAGNHDWAVVGRVDVEYFNSWAKSAVVWTREHLSREGFDFLNQLDMIYENNTIALVHATLPHPEEFDYLSDINKVTAMFPLIPKNICFIGHTHVPEIFIQQPGRSVWCDTMSVQVDQAKKYIVNVGSVGQPRDGNPQAAYCIYDLDKNTMAIKRTRYDIHEAQKRILKAGLPPFLADRLSSGE